MWLKLVFLLLFLITVEAQDVSLPDESEFKDVSKELIGKTIHLHWLYKRGYYLGATSYQSTFGGGLNLTELGKDEVYLNDWTRFQVVDCGCGFVCIKAMSEGGKYVKWTIKSTKVIFSGYPQNKDDFRWQIECTNNKFEICRIKNAGTKSFMTAHIFDHTFLIPPTGLFDFYGKYQHIYFTYSASTFDPRTVEALFEIKAPKPDCELEIFESFINTGSTDIKHEVFVKKGITWSSSSKFTLTVGLQAEISGAFKAISLSVAGSMETAMETSSTTTQVHEKTVKTTYTIPPNSKYQMMQKVGNYGPFKIKTTETVVKCTDPYTGEECFIRDAKKKMKEKEKQTEKTE